MYGHNLNHLWSYFNDTVERFRVFLIFQSNDLTNLSTHLLIFD